MNNIGKHAGAGLVHLGLKMDEKNIVLIIEDNGEGFNPATLYSGEGITNGTGLSSMKERVELSGGTLFLQSTQGQGTVIKVVWPK